MYSVTIFKSPRWWEEQQRFVYDNKTHRRLDFDSWDKFAKFLHKLSQRPLQGKQDAELISPAVFEPGTTRKNKHVIEWAGWAALDIDDVKFEGDFDAWIRTRFGCWDCIVYSTASSSVAIPKFRVVFRLDSSVRVDEIRHFWHALNSEFESVGDKQVKDFARMYYIPANYSGAFNFYYCFHGAPISVSALLAKWPHEERKGKNIYDALPDEWKKQILDHKRATLDNTQYSWSSYLDCPFINKNMLNEWMSISNIDGTGRYRMVYKMMVSIASSAFSKGYPITVNELVSLIREIDAVTSRKYETRPLDVEAQNAIEYAYKHANI